MRAILDVCWCSGTPGSPRSRDWGRPVRRSTRHVRPAMTERSGGALETERSGGASMTVRILIVDDQAMVRQGFAALLGAQPDLVVVGDAADGAAGIAAAREYRPDVVLMDI